MPSFVRTAKFQAFAVHEQFYPAVIYLSTDKICLAVMYNFVLSPQLGTELYFETMSLGSMVILCLWAGKA